jgi:flagellar basal-body rod modification protein FlgD
MAINAYGNNLATNGVVGNTSEQVANKTKLGKDDFMKLFLVQLQHQDPTEPMDTEKILTQTTQLATIESADNTNKALEELANSLSSSQQFSTISAIGKTADLGDDSIRHAKNSSSTFDIFFPDDVSQGTIDITDSNGQIIKTIDVTRGASGVKQFTWDGTNGVGDFVDDGIYHVNAKYTNTNGESKETKLGAYPIESVRFDEGKTFLKLGSSYVELGKVKEVY